MIRWWRDRLQFAEPPPVSLAVRLFIVLVALLCGATSPLGFSPYGWFGLPILTLAVLFWLWRHFPALAGQTGWLFGLGWFASGISWLYVTLHHYGHIPAVLSILLIGLFSGYLALFPALTGWLYPRFSGAWQLAALWTLFEWVRGWLFTGFPWLAVGYSQIPDSLLASWAPVGGILAVNFTTVLIAAWLSLLRWRPAVLVIGLFGLSFWLEQVQWTHADQSPVSVSLLQGNVDEGEKWRADALTTTLLRYARMVQASHAQLIVLPETAIPLFSSEIPSLFLDDLSVGVKQRGGDVLYGIPEDLNGHYYNSLMSIGISPAQVYRKVHLVPFGEFVPMHRMIGKLLDVLGLPMSDFSSGASDQPSLLVSGQRIGADICYEDVFGDEIIHALPKAGILVNVTNDGWFGPGIAPWQHAQMSQARALETGRYMLRATNSGVTTIINPKGHMVAHLPIFTLGTLNGEAQSYAGSTPYVRFGDAPVLLLVLVILIAGALRRQSFR